MPNSNDDNAFGRLIGGLGNTTSSESSKKKLASSEFLSLKESVYFKTGLSCAA